jgi:polysaccharide pyruvyl transferase WcaK-like protein
MISSRCKFWKKNLVIYDRLTVQKTLDMISTFDAVINTRLHSGIFSLISGVPFVDLTHHDKNKNFLETCGLQDFGISYWSFGSVQLASLLNRMLAEKIDLTTARQSQKILLRASTKHVCFDQSTRCDQGNI